MALNLAEGSLDRREFQESLKPASLPLQGERVRVDFRRILGAEPEPGAEACGASVLDLCGEWELAKRDAAFTDEDYISGDLAWKNALKARIPQSVQSTHLENGLIPDPMLDRNNLGIAWMAESRWCYRRIFRTPDDLEGKRLTLIFEGVDYSGSFHLNGEKLCDHEGMFGGPECEITGKLKPGRENVLVVLLDPAPAEEPFERFGAANVYRHLKTNVVYGWHYVKLISLGIWRPVRIRIDGSVRFDQPPFIATESLTENGAKAGIGFFLDNAGVAREVALDIRIVPRNFAGDGFAADLAVDVPTGRSRFLFDAAFDGVRRWWPRKFGDPDLYSFIVTMRQDGAPPCTYRSNLGFRTLELAPCSFGPKEDVYNWQFVINGEKHWIAGANWCSPDPLLRFGEERYARFIELAVNGHFDLLRVWGGGPIETDAFYDQCDEQGILVWQEFPMYGLSLADEIPVDLCVETGRRNAVRLRNRPSLAVWCGANEMFYSWFEKYNGTGRANAVLGRQVMECDGTRPYRTSCPYGGDVHWYGVYWGDQPITDYRTSIEDIRIGEPPGRSGIEGGPVAYTEWGLASPANPKTWKRILPEEELAWPLRRDGMFVHHTPTFSDVHIDRMAAYGSDFKPIDDFGSLVTGSQLAQGWGFRYVIERMRSRKPYTTATFLYKLTENYPACSWSALDYYAVPKLSYYMAKHAQAKIAPFVLFDRWNVDAGGLGLRLCAVNDGSAAIPDARFVYREYDADLARVDAREYSVPLPTDRSVAVDLLSIGPSDHADIFFVAVDLLEGDRFLSRNWYPFNHAGASEKLWNRRRASVDAKLAPQGDGFVLTVRNDGPVPVLGLHADPGEATFSYYADDGCLFVDAGETATIAIRRAKAVDGREFPLEGVTLHAHNLDPVYLDCRNADARA